MFRYCLFAGPLASLKHTELEKHIKYLNFHLAEFRTV